jgi:hypothetical protein
MKMPEIAKIIILLLIGGIIGWYVGEVFYKNKKKYLKITSSNGSETFENYVDIYSEYNFIKWLPNITFKIESCASINKETLEEKIEKDGK